MIRIGYVGVNTGLTTASKTFRLANYSEERMLDTARGNLEALKGILQWNAENRIHLFRITSGLIPFGSHPANSGTWRKVLRKDLEEIGTFIRNNAMRVSMHPGQYTVLNSLNKSYYQNALEDLAYHDSVLSLMRLNRDHVIIVHGGGVYGKKDVSLGRLLERINGLPSHVRKRLALENDERSFTAEDIYTACRKARVAAIFDVLHHQALPSFGNSSPREIILKLESTWSGRRQKIHYSNQAPSKGRGAHSEHIDVKAFGELYEEIRDLELDVMLETKDKQRSVLALREAYPDLQ